MWTPRSPVQPQASPHGQLLRPLWLQKNPAGCPERRSVGPRCRSLQIWPESRQTRGWRDRRSVRQISEVGETVQRGAPGTVLPVRPRRRAASSGTGSKATTSNRGRCPVPPVQLTNVPGGHQGQRMKPRLMSAQAWPSRVADKLGLSPEDRRRPQSPPELQGLGTRGENNPRPSAASLTRSPRELGFPSQPVMGAECFRAHTWHSPPRRVSGWGTGPGLRQRLPPAARWPVGSWEEPLRSGHLALGRSPLSRILPRPRGRTALVSRLLKELSGRGRDCSPCVLTPLGTWGHWEEWTPFRPQSLQSQTSCPALPQRSARKPGRVPLKPRPGASRPHSSPAVVMWGAR